MLRLSKITHNLESGRWVVIEKILDNAIELHEDEQNSYIDYAARGDKELKNEVLTLLKAIQASEEENFLDKSTTKNKAFIRDITLGRIKDRYIGKKIGAFELIEQIGYGGMSIVFKAERTDGQFEQQVAVKLIRGGMHSEQILRRFEREKQILASLTHPNIARLYDGGITKDDNPYLIMEYVEGKPIDIYCDEHKLTINQRLTLFKEVCNAVEFAHHNLIVHRDLKAQNILVNDNGTVKILDFGIAKLLKTNISAKEILLTQDGQQLWTPQYASPEQVEGATAAVGTDVYSLGVLLHKLLTGRFPYDVSNKSNSQVRDIITRQEPETLQQSLNLVSSIDKISEERNTTPHRLNKKFDKDLESIALKSLEKSISDRYSTVAAFVQDIVYYKMNMPINARKGNRTHVFKKFLTRRKKPLIVALGIFFLITAFTVFYTLQITKERNYAQLQAQKAEQLTVFVLDLFKANEPSENKGEQVTAGELLTRAQERVELLESQPAIQAKMFDVIGRIYRRLGEYESSYNMLTKSFTMRKNLFGSQHMETLASMDHLGILLTKTGDYSTADSLLTQTLKIRQSNGETDQLAIITTQNNLAYALRRGGYYKKAEALYRNSIEALEKQLGNDNPIYIETLSSLATTLHNLGKYAKAEEIYREVLKRRRELLGPIHPKLAQSINNLGAILLNRGRFIEAEGLFREALAMRKQLYGPNHPNVALMLNNLGYVLYNQHKYLDAAPYFKQALAMRKRIYGPNSISSAISLFCIGHLMLGLNKPDSALKAFENAYTIFKANYTDDHSFTIRSSMGMGSAYLKLGEPIKAGEYLKTGFQQIKKVHDSSSLEYALSEKLVGIYMLSQKNFDEADALFEHALQTLQAIEGEHSLRQDELKELLSQSHNQRTKTK